MAGKASELPVPQGCQPAGKTHVQVLAEPVKALCVHQGYAVIRDHQTSWRAHLRTGQKMTELACLLVLEEALDLLLL